jgi:AraC-like DNA-binding protein/quercetin dioxygenase-like cupin family protein
MENVRRQRHEPQTGRLWFESEIGHWFDTEIQSVPRPVVARAYDYPPGLCTEMHTHARAQLVFAASGTMTVTTERGIWVVPPQRAVWIPAGVKHAVQSTEQLNMRSIFVDPAHDSGLCECSVINVTPLLRELILHAITLPKVYKIGGPEDRIMTVLLEQIKALPLAPLHLPMPTDRRLLRIANALIKNPADKRSVEQWGREVGAGARTLSRLFPQQTGMSFRLWQQQVRLLEALRRLAAGAPVTNVALEIGYESPSAFVLMFKRSLGKTPGQYFDWKAA